MKNFSIIAMAALAGIACAVILEQRATIAAHDLLLQGIGAQIEQLSPQQEQDADTGEIEA